MKKKEIQLKVSEESQLKCSQPKYIWGWDNSEEVAGTVWSSIHSSLLSGELLFAYRCSVTTKDSSIKQVIVVKNIDKPGDFGVGMFTTGYSMLLPHVPIDYLRDLVTEMRKDRINGNIVDNFEQIIKEHASISD